MARKQLGTTPSTASDAVTKDYVDAAISGHRVIQTVTTAVTLGSAEGNDYIVYISGVNGAPRLPTAIGNTSRYTIKNIYSETKTVLTTNEQTVEGGILTLYPEDSVDIVSDGAAWRIV